jgi:hypothetical protein
MDVRSVKLDQLKFSALKVGFTGEVVSVYIMPLAHTLRAGVARHLPVNLDIMSDYQYFE